ncbi:hypothetical protein EB796_004589 [Bugula neritina]|uniref:Uncharacterized protein n=1 Tax=Bugula neritina TaxID=10212 RepID=A0A7J7KFX1_BUGNE|nr:hypothetical protein EB796_004589 [Bugula neritina]
MPFTPTVELLETNYSQSAFYGPSFQWLKTLGKYGGEEKPVPSSVTTTGNILKLSFANTGDYKGDLTITIDTKTDFDPNESLYVAIGLGVACTLIIVFVVVCVVVKRRRRINMSRRGEPILITSAAY